MLALRDGPKRFNNGAPSLIPGTETVSILIGDDLSARRPSRQGGPPGGDHKRRPGQVRCGRRVFPVREDPGFGTARRAAGEHSHVELGRSGSFSD
jgi:hypothetical protein